MALKDPALNRAIAVQHTIKKAKNKLTPDGSPTAKNAAKISNRNTPSKEEIIKSIINSINGATQSGEYYITQLTPNRFENDIAQYFTKKGYIVAINKNKHEIFIAWIGGKKWRRSFTGKDTADVEIYGIINKTLIGTVQTDLSWEPSHTKWINPKVKDGTTNFPGIGNIIKNLP